MNEQQEVCAAYSGLFFCTENAGHTGPHIALGPGSVPLAVWPRPAVKLPLGQLAEAFEKARPLMDKALAEGVKRMGEEYRRLLADPPPTGIFGPPPELPEGACTFCGGDGEINDSAGDGPCPVCRGTGERLSDEEVLRLRRKLRKWKRRAKKARKEAASHQQEWRACHEFLARVVQLHDRLLPGDHGNGWLDAIGQLEQLTPEHAETARKIEAERDRLGDMYEASCNSNRQAQAELEQTRKVLRGAEHGYRTRLEAARALLQLVLDFHSADTEAFVAKHGHGVTTREMCDRIRAGMGIEKEAEQSEGAAFRAALTPTQEPAE